MRRDKYQNFTELHANEKRDVDFSVTVRKTKSKVAVIAPHAGQIEPKTSEIAKEIAGTDLCLYLFEGKKSEANFETLHVTSENFNDSACL